MDFQSERESKSNATSTEASTESSNTSTRRKVLKAASVAGIAGIAGCGGAGGSSGPESFKIGLNAPLSGGNSLLGEAMANASEIAKTELNSDDGIVGRDIELVRADNEGDPQKGVERTNQLINEDSVDVILGPVSSAVRNSMTPVCAENDTPLLYPTSYEGPAAPDYCNEYLFKFSWIPAQQVNPVVPWLMEEYGDTFYLLGSDYLWPQEMNAAIRERVEANGGEVLAEEYVQISATDFSSTIVDIEQKDPDVLMTEVVGASPAALQNQLRNRDLRGNFAEVGLAHSEPSIAGLGQEAAEDLIHITGWHSNIETEATQQFMEKYYEEYGDDAVIGGIGAWCYVTMNMLDKALADAEDASTETVLSSLPGTEYESMSGPIKMTQDHQMRVPNVAAQVNENVEFETIKKFDAAMPDDQCSEI